MRLSRGIEERSIQKSSIPREIVRFNQKMNEQVVHLIVVVYMEKQFNSFQFIADSSTA